MPRKPTRLQLVMELTARHIETVGLHQGAALTGDAWDSYPPLTYTPNEPCSLLSAFDRAQRAVAGRTVRASGRRGRRGSRRAHHPAEFSEALRTLSDHLADEPITADQYEPLGLSEADFRRIVIACWGEAEGRTGAEAARAVRAASPVCF